MWLPNLKFKYGNRVPISLLWASIFFLCTQEFLPEPKLNQIWRVLLEERCFIRTFSYLSRFISRQVMNFSALRLAVQTCDIETAITLWAPHFQRSVAWETIWIKSKNSKNNSRLAFVQLHRVHLTFNTRYSISESP